MLQCLFSMASLAFVTEVQIWPLLLKCGCGASSQWHQSSMAAQVLVGYLNSYLGSQSFLVSALLLNLPFRVKQVLLLFLSAISKI